MILLHQVESSFPEMSLEQSASRAAVKEGSPQPAPTPRVARAPQDLTKLAPLPSTKELQEKLRERYVFVDASSKSMKLDSFIYSRYHS